MLDIADLAHSVQTFQTYLVHVLSASGVSSLVLRNRRLSVGVLISLPIAYFVYSTLVFPFYVSPLRKLRGPKVRNPFLLLGNLPEVLKVDPAEMQRKWVKEYGEVIVMRSLMNRPQVIVASSSGVRHMLQTHPERYDKSNPAFRILNRILGNGVLTTDGDVHRRQRAILNPVFRVKNINALIPVFVQSAHEVRASWNDAFHSQAILTINVSEEMAKPTLDVIGRAGFGYEFNAVSSGQSPLFKSFCTVMDMFTLPNLLFDIYFPFAKWILPTEFLRHARIRRARAQIMDACRTLVADKKRAIEGGGKLGASSDLLSVLLRANMEEADPTKRMSDEETGAQVITFLLAGHETTSVALTWCLDLLSKDARVQAKLREDLVADMPNAADDPSDDLLLSTTNYLEAVTKENLRVQPPVPLTSRYCTIDDTIDGHFIPRGTLVSVYPDVMAKKESVWGADALTFRPERWQESDSETKPFGSFMPFMMGPRNCIGSRFAILEFKAILAVLVRNFEFAPIEGQKVRKVMHLTVKPEPFLKMVVSRV